MFIFCNRCILLANSSLNNSYLFLQKYFGYKVWEEFSSLEDFMMLQNAPSWAILSICMGVNKINTFVVLFYLYPGKEVLPDSVKTVKSLKIEYCMSCYFVEREKKNLLVEFMMLWHHTALAIWLSGNKWMRNFKVLGYFWFC